MPSLILTPTMVGAQGLAVLLRPVSYVQKVLGSKATLSDRLARWARVLPGAPTSTQVGIVLAVPNLLDVASSAPDRAGGVVTARDQRESDDENREMVSGTI